MQCLDEHYFGHGDRPLDATVLPVAASLFRCTIRHTSGIIPTFSSNCQPERIFDLGVDEGGIIATMAVRSMDKVATKSNERVKRSIVLDAEISAGAEQRAEQEMRSFSSYVAWLIQQDVKRNEPELAEATR